MYAGMRWLYPGSRGVSWKNLPFYLGRYLIIATSGFSGIRSWAWSEWVRFVLEFLRRVWRMLEVDILHVVRSACTDRVYTNQLESFQVHDTWAWLPLPRHKWYRDRSRLTCGKSWHENEFGSVWLNYSHLMDPSFFTNTTFLTLDREPHLPKVNFLRTPLLVAWLIEHPSHLSHAIKYVTDPCGRGFSISGFRDN